MANSIDGKLTLFNDREKIVSVDTPHTVRCNLEVLIIAASLRLTFFSSELAGDTPHTVRCNLEVLIIAASLCLTFCFSSELAGDTPHTVRCNLEMLIIAATCA